MAHVPKHEELKKNLISKFGDKPTYSAKHIQQTISHADFKILDDKNKPNFIKRGDVFISFGENNKPRPCVVLKVLKDKTVLYTTLTSTENIHNLCRFKSRFFSEGWFSKHISVCTEEMAINKFVGVFDSISDLNKATKMLKDYLKNNL